jgi:hypothetical protein
MVEATDLRNAVVGKETELQGVLGRLLIEKFDIEDAIWAKRSGFLVSS